MDGSSEGMADAGRGGHGMSGRAAGARPKALVIGRFPPHAATSADDAAARAIGLVQAGYAVETIAVAGSGHLSAPFDRAYGLRAMRRWLGGRRFDLLAIERDALAFRRPDSLSRLGVLFLQCALVLRLVLCTRRLQLHPDAVSIPGRPRVARLTTALLRALAARAPGEPRPDAPPAGDERAAPDDGPAEAWSRHLHFLARLADLVPGGERRHDTVVRLADIWDAAPTPWKEGRLAHAAQDAGVATRYAALDRAGRAVAAALEPDPAWAAPQSALREGARAAPGDAPVVARWMSHLAEEARASGRAGIPAASPAPDAAPDQQALAAFRLVAWAESALAGWPLLARRRATLARCRRLLEGVGTEGSLPQAIGALPLRQGRSVLPPPSASTRAAFWSALARSGGLAVPIVPTVAKGKAQSRATSRDDHRALDILLQGKDAFGDRPGLDIPEPHDSASTGIVVDAAAADEFPTRGRVAQRPASGAPLVLHGRSGGVDPLTRALLGRLSRAGSDAPCALGAGQRWRRPLHILDLSPGAATARLLDAGLGPMVPDAAIVLMQDGAAAAPAIERLALAMVDAVWCLAPADAARLSTHCAATVAPISVLSPATGREADAAHRLASQQGVKGGSISAGEPSSLTDEAAAPALGCRRRADAKGAPRRGGRMRKPARGMPWRAPGLAEARATCLVEALRKIDVMV